MRCNYARSQRAHLFLSPNKIIHLPILQLYLHGNVPEVA